MSFSGPRLDLNHNHTELSCIQKNLRSNGLQEEIFKFENEQPSIGTAGTYIRKNRKSSHMKNVIMKIRKNYNFVTQMKNLNTVKKAINTFKNFNSSRKPDKLLKFHYDFFDDFTISPFCENIETKVRYFCFLNKLTIQTKHSFFFYLNIFNFLIEKR